MVLAISVFLWELASQTILYYSSNQGNNDMNNLGNVSYDIIIVMEGTKLLKSDCIPPAC